MKRPLLEDGSDSFIRFNQSVSIIRKVRAFNEEIMENYVSARKPFGDIIPHKTKQTGDLSVYAYPDNGFISKDNVSSNKSWIDKYKVFITKAYGERGDFPYFIIGKPFLGMPNEICTETYLVAYVSDDREFCENIISYMRTKFFRFLVLQKKNTQNAPRNVYSFVPMQNFSESWSDEKLYKKYGLTNEEIGFIESLIKPMELTLFDGYE